MVRLRIRIWGEGGGEVWNKDEKRRWVMEE